MAAVYASPARGNKCGDPRSPAPAVQWVFGAGKLECLHDPAPETNMNRLGIAAMSGAIFFASTLAFAADAIRIERVFGRNFPDAYKHPVSLTELANGDLYLVYYGGSDEYGDDTGVRGARLAKGSAQWSSPMIIADTPFRGDGNAVVWQSPEGLVWLFYVNRYGKTWSNSRIKFKVSYDGAETWSDSDMLSFDEGTMVRSRPIVLNNGDYLLPVYRETGNDQEFVAHDTGSYFYRMKKGTHDWVPTKLIHSSYGNLQPSVVQITDDYLVAYSRRAGGYGPKDHGRLIRSESHDGGLTWSDGTESKFPNPNAATDFIKLRNGHLLLVYNDNEYSTRMPLTVAISTDGDKSYPFKRNIINKPGDSAAYPTAIQTSDGKIHIVYTSERRTVINHAVFDEDVILASGGH
jgi:predicted neuraminidase